MSQRTMLRIILAFALGYMLAFSVGSFTRANTIMDGLINQSRTTNGLSALTTSSTLTALAEQRALEIKDNFAHDFWWWDASGCNGIGENLAWRTPPAENPEQYAHNQFMASPDHHANIMGDWDLVGTALLIIDGAQYAVQLFGNDCGGNTVPPPGPTPEPAVQPTPVPVQNPPVGQPAQPTVVQPPVVQLPDTSVEKP